MLVKNRYCLKYMVSCGWWLAFHKSPGIWRRFESNMVFVRGCGILDISQTHGRSAVENAAAFVTSIAFEPQGSVEELAGDESNMSESTNVGIAINRRSTPQNPGGHRFCEPLFQFELAHAGGDLVRIDETVKQPQRAVAVKGNGLETGFWFGTDCSL